MGRLDLQLFALKLNTDTSIVDYLKSQGQDSSYNNRKKIASQYGISNYTGSASQNTKLLQMLKNSSASSTTSNKATSGKTTTGTTTVNKNNNKNTNNAANKNTGKNTASSGNTSDAVQTATNVLAGQSNALTAGDIANSGVVIGGAFGNVGGTTGNTQAVEPTFTPTAAPTYTPQQYTTPTFTQVQTPTYNGQTTQANQATTIDQRLPADTLAALNSQFQVSQAYQQAMDYTNSMLQQLSTGKTTYSDQIAQLISDYQNRDKFSYDSNSDPLFQQALSSAMRSGKTAMQDTMGQAAALTGGYGSTYATNVGQSAYNQYVQEAYDMLPEYYQLALEAYNMEGNNMLTQLSLLDSEDSKEYDRLNNAYNANYNNAQNLYSQEYAAWQDSVNNAYNYAGLLNSDYWNKMDYDENIRQYDQNFNYQQYQDALSQSNWQNQFNYQQYADQIAQNQWASEFDYQKYLDQLSQSNRDNEFAYQQYMDAINQGNVEWEQNFAQNEANRDQSNIDWEHGFSESESDREQGNIEWEQNFTEGEAERDQGNIDWEHGFSEDEAARDQSNINWEQGFAEDESDREQGNWEKQYNQDVYEFDASLGEDKRQFNESLSEDKRQFDETMGYNKTQAAQDQANYEREMAIKESQAKSEAAKANGEYEYKTPTQTMYNGAIEAYETGGETALEQYLETAPDYDITALYDYATEYGTVGLEARTYTKTKDTTNWLGGVDGNDVVTDQYGNTYKISDLPKSVREQLSSLKEGESYDFSTGKKVTK